MSTFIEYMRENKAKCPVCGQSVVAPDKHKLHVRHRKALIIDATNYPLIIVIKPLSMRGALKNDVLYGDEEAGAFYRQFYDYQPEDLEGGGEVQWLKDRNERASCLRSLSRTSA